MLSIRHGGIRRILLTVVGLIVLLALAFTTFVSCHKAQPNPRQQLTETLRAYACSDSILFGQHDATLYGHTWNYVTEGEATYSGTRSDCSDVTGRYPAVISFDLGHLETGSELNIDSVPFAVIRRAILAQWERGGIVSLSWHPTNPLTGGSSWDTTCDTVVHSLLPGQANHAILIDWLDKVNFFLSSLTVANPQGVLLFRPWHENNGTWFWWGASCCSSEDYIALYRFTHDYLSQNNDLVWAYSPNLGADETTYMQYYPGDAYIDLLGIDCYHFEDQTDEVYTANARGCLDLITKIGAEHHKPIAFTETGLQSVQRPYWYTQTLLPIIRDYPIAYVLVWRNAWNNPIHYYVPFAGDTAEQDFIQFINNSTIITR